MLPVVPAEPQPRPLQPRILQEEAPVLGQPLVAEQVSVLQLARSVTGSVTPLWSGVVTRLPPASPGYGGPVHVVLMDRRGHQIPDKLCEGWLRVPGAETASGLPQRGGIIGGYKYC